MNSFAGDNRAQAVSVKSLTLTLLVAAGLESSLAGEGLTPAQPDDSPFARSIIEESESQGLEPAARLLELNKGETVLPPMNSDAPEGWPLGTTIFPTMTRVDQGVWNVPLPEVSQLVAPPTSPSEAQIRQSAEMEIPTVWRSDAFQLIPTEWSHGNILLNDIAGTVTNFESEVDSPHQQENSWVPATFPSVAPETVHIVDQRWFESLNSASEPRRVPR